MTQQEREKIMQLFDAATIDADEAFDRYQEATRAYKTAQQMKYEITESDNGDEIYTPLSAVIENFRQEALDSGEFVPKGKTKEERAAELEAWLMSNDPRYADAVNRLNGAEMKTVLADADLKLAERQSARANAKFGAVRAMAELFAQEVALEVENKKQQHDAPAVPFVMGKN